MTSQTRLELPHVAYKCVRGAGLSVPAGTPAPVVDRLSSELAKAIAAPDFKTRLDSLSYSPGGIDRFEFGKMLERDSVLWSRLTKQANIEPN